MLLTVVMSRTLDNYALIKTFSRLRNPIPVHDAIDLYVITRREDQLPAEYRTTSVYLFEFSIEAADGQAAIKAILSFCGASKPQLLSNFGLPSEEVINPDDVVVRKCDLAVRKVALNARAQPLYLAHQLLRVSQYASIPIVDRTCSLLVYVNA